MANGSTSSIKLFKQFKNAVIVITDGYVESANKEKGYQLDKSSVDLIRKEFKASGQEDLRKFIISNEKFHLKRTSKDLSQCNILVTEFFDRSLNSNGVATIQPTDFEILEIVWKKWLFDSGAKTVEILPKANSKAEYLKSIENFLLKL